MNLNSSVDTIYGELSERQDCLDWLHERTGQNWYVVTIEEGYAFEIVHYFDADLGCRDGLVLFMVFLAVRIDDERVKTAVRSFARNLYVAINRLYRDKCGQD